MNSEKLRQIQEGQWEEGLAMIAGSIFRGYCKYQDFLNDKPDTKAKKYVDDWLNGHLAMPKYKGKIIPGFND